MLGKVASDPLQRRGPDRLRPIKRLTEPVAMRVTRRLAAAWRGGDTFFRKTLLVTNFKAMLKWRHVRQDHPIRLPPLRPTYGILPRCYGTGQKMHGPNPRSFGPLAQRTFTGTGTSPIRIITRCAGLAVPYNGGSSIRQSSIVIPIDSTSARTRRIGGFCTTTPAAVELGALMVYGSTAKSANGRKPKRSYRSGESKRTGGTCGE